MLDVLGIAQSDKDAIAACYEALKKKYDCVIESGLNELFSNKLSGAQLLEDYHSITIKNVFKCGYNGSEFYLLTLYLTEIGASVDYKSLIFGAINFKKPQEPISIYPESLWDKMSKFFGGKRYTEFNGLKNKYCISNGDQKMQSQHLPQAFLDKLSNVDKIYLEFRTDFALATFNNPINVEDTLALADFLSKTEPLF